MTARGSGDPDELAVRRASRSVGLQLALAAGALVLVVLIGSAGFILSRVKAVELLSGHREAMIQVGALDVLEGGVLVGAVAVVVAGALSLVATRRAVQPLASALRSQRSFVADASHELRTPLTVLDTRLQYLRRAVDDDVPLARDLDELRRDTRELVQIVDDLLATAEVEGARSEQVDAGVTVGLAVDSLRPLAAERRVRMEVETDPGVGVAAPAVSLRRSVVALLDNALAHSPEGGIVRIRVEAEGAYVSVSVRDEGRGIRGIEPERVFERFARGEGAESRRGSGIGLALVQETAQRFGRGARVVTTGPEGTEIALLLDRRGARTTRRGR